MAIIVTVIKTDNIDTIYNALKESVIPTWQMDSDGDITITNTRWCNKAWFRIETNDNTMTFGIVGSRRFPLTNELYGVYHGRLTSTLLAYFNHLFIKFEIITSANNYDYIP